MNALVRLLRPQQWTKNLFVFMPLFFSGRLTDTRLLANAVIVFFAYSFAASSIYCFNDIADVEADRHHPVKCQRPIASGKISIGMGYALMSGMLLLSIVMLFMLPGMMVGPMAVIGGYWLMNMLYCWRLKHYAIVDVCIIAFGFVLRIIAGGAATNTMVSHWLVMMTFLLTLFLSLAKRRDDVLRMMRTGEPPRHNTSRYNLTFMNQSITITASVMLVCYIMYTVSSDVIANFGTPYVYLTSIYVLLGILRYIQLTVVDEKTGDPTSVMLHDHPTLFIVSAWVVTFLIIIYT